MVVKLYVSGISGNKEVKKKQQRVQMILDSKSITYEAIDITEPGREKQKEFMQQKGKVRENLGKHPLPPQIFNEDDYCGDYDDFDMANETDELEAFLHLPIPTKLSSFDKTPKLNGSREENNVNLDTSDVKTTEADGIEVELTSLSTDGADTNATTEDAKDGETADDEVEDKEETDVPDAAKDVNDPPAESLDEPKAEENSEVEDSDEAEDETEAIVETQEALNESKEASTRETVFTDSVAEETSVVGGKSRSPDKEIETNKLYSKTELNNESNVTDRFESNSRIARVSGEETIELNSSVNDFKLSNSTLSEKSNLGKEDPNGSSVELDENSNTSVIADKNTQIIDDSIGAPTVDDTQAPTSNSDLKQSTITNIGPISLKEDRGDKFETLRDCVGFKRDTPIRESELSIERARESQDKVNAQNIPPSTSLLKTDSELVITSDLRIRESEKSEEKTRESRAKVDAQIVSRNFSGSKTDSEINITSECLLLDEELAGVNHDKRIGGESNEPSVGILTDIEIAEERFKENKSINASLKDTVPKGEKPDEGIAISEKSSDPVNSAVDSAEENRKQATLEGVLPCHISPKEENSFDEANRSTPKASLGTVDDKTKDTLSETEAIDKDFEHSGVNKSFKGVTVEVVAKETPHRIETEHIFASAVSDRVDVLGKTTSESVNTENKIESNNHLSSELVIQKEPSKPDSKGTSKGNSIDQSKKTMDAEIGEVTKAISSSNINKKVAIGSEEGSAVIEVISNEASGEDIVESKATSVESTTGEGESGRGRLPQLAGTSFEASKDAVRAETSEADEDLLAENEEVPVVKLVRRDTQRRISVEKKRKSSADETVNTSVKDTNALSDSETKIPTKRLDSLSEIEDSSLAKHEGVLTNELIFEKASSRFDVDKITISPQLQHVLEGPEGDEEKGIFVKSWNRRVSEADIVKHVRSLLNVRDAKVASRRGRDGRSPDPHSEFLDKINCLISDVEFEEDEVSWPVVTPPKEPTPPPPPEPPKPIHPQSAFIQEVLRVLNTPSTPRILQNPNKIVIPQPESKFIKEVKNLLNSEEHHDEGRSVYFVKERAGTGEDGEFVKKVRVLLDETEEELRLADGSKKAENVTVERDHSGFLNDVFVLLNDNPMNETEMENKGELHYLESDEEEEQSDQEENSAKKQVGQVAVVSQPVKDSETISQPVKEIGAISQPVKEVTAISQPAKKITQQDTLIEKETKQTTVVSEDTTPRRTAAKDEPKSETGKNEDINLGNISCICCEGERITVPLSLHTIKKDYNLCLRSPYVQSWILVDKEVNIGDLIAIDSDKNEQQVAKLIVTPNSRASK